MFCVPCLHSYIISLYAQVISTACTTPHLASPNFTPTAQAAPSAVSKDCLYLPWGLLQQFYIVHECEICHRLVLLGSRNRRVSTFGQHHQSASDRVVMVSHRTVCSSRVILLGHYTLTIFGACSSSEQHRGWLLARFWFSASSSQLQPSLQPHPRPYGLVAFQL